MKVLLLQDVYKLGRAGDVKKVANGYGRNYLIPQGLAVLATPGAMSQADTIRVEANKQRAIINEEMGGIAEMLKDVILTVPARASETGPPVPHMFMHRLYRHFLSVKYLCNHGSFSLGLLKDL